MGTFVTDTSTVLFPDKTPAPGLSLRSGWTTANVTQAADMNALRDATYDLRTAHVALQSELDASQVDIATNAANFATLGVVSTSAALIAATSANNVFVTPGTYTISASLTFTGFVQMAKGAILSIASGQTVTFNGGFDAPVTQVFKTTGQSVAIVGSVAFASKKTVIGLPEWWGCVTAAGDATNATNNNTALDACTAAVGIIQLQKTDYWIQSTWNVRTRSVTIRGIPGEPGTGAGMTRIIIRSATADVMSVGIAVYDSNNNNWLQNVTLEDFEVTRDTSPSAFPVQPPAAGLETSACAGIRFKWTLYTYVNRVWSRENIIGFAFQATVQPHMTKCYAARSTAKDATSVNADFWWGFYFDGALTSPFPAANASSYIRDCNASLGGVIASTGASPITSRGFNLVGPCSDLYFHGCETLKTQYGFECGGVGAGGTSTQRHNGSIDCNIMSCVVDQFTRRGFYFHDMPTGTAVLIGGGTYAAAAGSGTTACYEVRDSGGNIFLQNAQAICNSVPSTLGLYVINSSGVNGDIVICNSQRPVGLDTSSGCRVTAFINLATDTTAVPTQGAVWMTGCTRNVIAPIVKSTHATSRYPFGIQAIGSGNGYNEFNCTGIDPAALTGASSALKLSINASNVTATGLSGTNLVSGVMA